MVDTSGPFHPTPGGTKYWVKFLCEYSGFCWDFFAPRKSMLPDLTDRLFNKLTQKKYKIRFLRCDDAGEHGYKLQVVCETYGVQIEYTGRNTHQRNGAVE